MSRYDTCYWCGDCAERCRGYRYAEPEVADNDGEENEDVGKEKNNGE